MKKLIATLAFAIALPALAVTTGVQDQVRTSSKQTYVLSPGSDAYVRWNAWIKKQQERKDIQLVGSGVGEITITVVSPESSSKPVSALSLSPVTAAAPQEPPPVDLPRSGTPGQRITIANRASGTSTYQVWTFTWESPANGAAAAWVLTGQGSCSFANCGVTITNPG